MLLIAEAGVNHNGKFRTALELVHEAKNAGADAVKFQYFSSQKLWGDDRIAHLELTLPQLDDIQAYCKALDIEFMCTAFGVEELNAINPWLKRIKIPSGLMTNKDLLRAAAKTKKPVILSTGMSELVEIGASTEFFERDLTILQCTSSYPCRLEDVNLQAMVNMRKLWWMKADIGLSDHTTSITVPIAATALGCAMIEKHLTLEREQEGPDHKASITPAEFKAMRLAIIEVEAAMGDGVKKIVDAEWPLRRAWRK